MIYRYLSRKDGSQVSSFPAGKKRSPVFSVMDFVYFVTLSLDVLSYILEPLVDTISIHAYFLSSPQQKQKKDVWLRGRDKERMHGYFVCQRLENLRKDL